MVVTTVDPPDATISLSDTALHIGTLFPPDSLAGEEFLEVRCFKKGRPGPQRFYKHTAILVADALRFADWFDVFVGVAPRRCPDLADIRACHHRGRGGKTHITRINWAFCEIDIGKGYDSLEAIVERLRELKQPPSMVVASGNGAHAYWRLAESIYDVDRFERLTRAIKRDLGHDNAIDISRVLRVAGTVNNKYDPPRPVRFLRNWRSGDVG